MGPGSRPVVRDPVGTPPASVAPAATARAGAAAAVRGPLGLVGGAARFGRFAAVGASGVVVNALALLLFVEAFGWPVLAASLLAIELSTLSNWFLNRHWTWNDRDDTALHSLAKYHGVAVVGMAMQWLVLAVTVSTTSVHYLVGTVLGVAAATAWNFAGNHLFSFRDRTAPPVPRWAVYATSAFIQLVVAGIFAHPWDTFVFQRSVEDLLLRGLTPYEVAEAAPEYTYWGGSLPALPMWYAYPPIPLALMAAAYFPSALGWVPWGWAGRVLIRLPFIAATLGVAAMARQLLRTAPRADAGTAARADQAERLLLLNPLFLVIAAIWGQFEALVLLLLLASVVALRAQHYGRSGLWWALAVCVKIFPLYLVPLLAVHLHRTGGRKAVLRFGGVAAAVGAAINLPFLIATPRGYLQQVLFMHGARPPARLAPLAYLGKLLRWASDQWAALPAREVWADWLGAVSLVLVVAVVLAIAAASRRKPASEGRLLEWMALTFLGGLLATKVLNEQYLLLPLGLLLVARAHPQRTLKPGMGLFVAVASWAVVAAGLLGGLNILYAVPPALAKAIFGGLAPEAVARVAGTFGLSASQLRSALNWATGMVLLGPALYAARRLWRPVADGLLVLERALLSGLRQGARATRPGLLAGSILVLCMAPLGVAIAGSLDEPDARQPLASGDRWVLAEVTTAWYNPTNDGERAEGTWDGVAAQPAVGYYTLNAHKAQTDVDLARRAGFDGLVIRVHPYYEGQAAILQRVAEAEGMPYALAVDVGGRDAVVGLEAASARQLRGTLDAPTLEFWRGRHHILDPDGQAYVVFLGGVERVQPTFTAAERRFVLDAWEATGPDPAAVALLEAGLAPRSSGDLLADTELAALWRDAYAVAERAWWAQALGTAQDLAFLTDAPLPADLGWLGPRSADEPKALEDAAAPARVRFTTLGGILAPDTVHAAWQKAHWTGADGVVVPWNDHRGEGAVEPTREHGMATLLETAKQIQAFRAPRIDHADAGPDDGIAQQAVGQVEDIVGDKQPRRNAGAGLAA